MLNCFGINPAEFGRCATLIGYPSMFFVNTLYVGHLIVEFCICILKAMTNYQPKTIQLFVVIDYATWPDIGII